VNENRQRAAGGPADEPSALRSRKPAAIRSASAAIAWLVPDATFALSFTDGAISSYEWSPDGQRIVLTHYLQMCDVVLLSAKW